MLKTNDLDDIDIFRVSKSDMDLWKSLKNITLKINKNGNFEKVDHENIIEQVQVNRGSDQFYYGSFQKSKISYLIVLTIVALAAVSDVPIYILLEEKPHMVERTSSKPGGQARAIITEAKAKISQS